jgi:subtilisin
MLLILIMVVSTLLSGASSVGIGTEKVSVIIAFHEQPGRAEEALIRAFGGSVKFTYNIVPAIAATVPMVALEGLARNPKVVRIEADVEIYALEVTTQDTPWGVDRIDADVVQAAGNEGTGVKVAVIDSGVDGSHPDLIGQLAGGFDFVNNDSNPMDDNGHGTHVVGTIAAVDNDLGVIGVAPGVDIYALKVLDASGSGNFSNIIAALDWCVKNGIQVTNNSYGSSVDPGISVQNAFINSYTAGVLHIASAGNSGKANGRGDNVGFPAQYDSVVAVAATDSNDARAYFSSTGPDVEIAAPGVAILSTVPGGGYESWNGTSMASPHVAGVAALVMASNSGLSNVDVRERLVSTAEDLGVAGRDTWFGYGLVDAEKAAAKIVDPVPDDPTDPPVDPPADSGNITVDGFTGTSTLINKIFWNAVVNVSLSTSLPNAVVTGQWQFGDSIKTVTAVTDANGDCTFNSGNISTKISTGSFKLTNITLSGYTFVLPEPNTINFSK